jgi:hypothetical protein
MLSLYVAMVRASSDWYGSTAVPSIGFISGRHQLARVLSLKQCGLITTGLDACQWEHNSKG